LEFFDQKGFSLSKIQENNAVNKGEVAMIIRVLATAVFVIERINANAWTAIVMLAITTHRST